MAAVQAETRSDLNGEVFYSSQNFGESIPLVQSLTVSESSFKAPSISKSGKELQRSLGFSHAFVFIVGILFGSGIFISPGLVANQTSNMGMAIAVWMISGIPCLFGALCYCELSCMYGKTGGQYIYLHEAYGKVVGFVCVWTQMMVITPVGMAVLSMAIGDHIIQPFYDINSSTGIWLTKMVAIIAVTISTVINCASTTFIGRLQIWFTVVQTLSVVFLVILGVWQVAIGNTANYVTMFDNSSNFEIGSFGLALYNGLWGYEGWGLTVAVSEELKDLERNLWLSIVTGIPFVIFCYVLVNLALMSVLTRGQMASSETVATTFVEKILGKKVALVIPFAVAFCAFGSINASTFMLARMLLSAAREGQLPYALSFIHNKRRTPIPAVLTFFVISLIWLLIPGIDMQALIAIFSLAIWTLYFLAIFSVIVMRYRKPEVNRPFKVWLMNPIFTSLVALFLVIIPFVKRPIQSLICLLIQLTALPVYYIFIKKFDSLPSCLHKGIDIFNEFLRRKCNLVPCIFVGAEYVADTVDESKL